MRRDHEITVWRAAGHATQDFSPMATTRAIFGGCSVRPRRVQKLNEMGRSQMFAGQRMRKLITFRHASRMTTGLAR